MSPIRGVCAAILVGLLLTGCQPEVEKAEVVRPVLTQTLAVEAVSGDRFAGVVVSQFETSLSFRVFGRVVERSVEVGDLVTPDQQIAQVDATDQQVAVRSAQANLDSTQAQLDNLIAVEQRQRSLLDQKNISASTYETAEQGLRAGKSAMAQAEAQLSKAKEQLAYTILRADEAGLVTAVSAEVGQTVQVGQTVVTIVRPEFRKAVISVIEGDASQFAVGDRFLIARQMDPSVTVEGRVEDIAPQADATTRTVAIDISLDDPSGKFRLGTSITATRAVDEDESLTLPASAVRKTNNGHAVWVVDTAALTVSQRQVELDTTRPGAFRVVAGLEPGETIVTAGVNSLSEGQKVTLIEGLAK